MNSEERIERIIRALERLSVSGVVRDLNRVNVQSFRQRLEQIKGLEKEVTRVKRDKNGKILSKHIDKDDAETLAELFQELSADIMKAQAMLMVL